jgi:cell wall-associated NlpC family hydrolase
MSHWTEAWIGTPWVAGETDRWNFARAVWAEEFDLDVPAMPYGGGPVEARRRFAGAAEMDAWRATPAPREGDAVLMAMGARPCHVGIWVDPCRVLHSVEGTGAVCTPPDALAGMGYRIVGFYRRVAA